MNRLTRRLYSVLLFLFLLLLANSLYLSLADDATAFTLYNVLGHILVGFVFAAFLVGYGVPHLLLRWRTGSRSALALGILSLLSFAACAATGTLLTYLGFSEGTRWMIYVHVASAPAGIVLFAAHRVFRRGVPSWRRPRIAAIYAAALAVLFVFGVRRTGDRAAGEPFELPPPVFGTAIGAAGSPFFAAAPTTASGRRISAEAYRSSEGCATSGCHEEIGRQWYSSAHRMAGFLDPFFKRSVLYNEARGSPRAVSKFCFGCHAPGALFSGAVDKGPLDESNPALREGISCVGCHSIDRVHQLKGNGSYRIEEPRFYPFETASNPWLREIGKTLVRTKPGPHKRAYLKPLHLTSEFCGACHRVGIPAAANSDVWKRGFDEYGSWQSGPWSGHRAATFYDLKESRRCQDCHMPPVRSNDPAAVGGKVHDHSFPGANTALAAVLGDEILVRKEEEFLRRNRFTVDILGYVPRNGRLVGPLRDGDALPAGEEIRLEVVVRTREIGHQFTGGTRDTQQGFVELTVTDDRGRLLLFSGRPDENGTLDDSAHVYRAYFEDRAGRIVEKRNAALDYITFVYSRHIDPGLSDAVHYRFRVPGRALVIRAALRYRKWTQPYYDWAMRGVPAADGPVDLLVDRRPWTLARYPVLPLEQPKLPLVLLAEKSLRLRAAPHVRDPDRADDDSLSRLYDYAVALLSQGDLAGAERTLRRIVSARPGDANAWVALGRVLLEEKTVTEAMSCFDRALRLRPALPRALYFRGLSLQKLGRYDESLEVLRRVETSYPKDRFLLLEMGRTCFYKKDYARAREFFERVLRIDPEEYLGICWMERALRAIGDRAGAERFEKLRLEYGFQPDPLNASLLGGLSAPAGGDRRLLEARPIHEHSLRPAK